jgi:hypothetical protein
MACRRFHNPVRPQNAANRRHRADDATAAVYGGSGSFALVEVANPARTILTSQQPTNS